MVSDDILEVSNSPVLNSLTVISKEGKKPRICVDACKMNQFTIPDYERPRPLQEFITTGFLDFVHRPEFYKQENKTFRKLNLFPSSGEGGTYSIRNLRIKLTLTTGDVK
jgi:hypothetical protein